MIKVLIVDDEALVRIGIKTLIPWQELGFELIGEAPNGKRALEMVHQMSPDIIFTDIKMPVMNGIELIKQLKKEQNHAKVIILSAFDDFAFVKEAMKLGAEDYVLKLELEPEQMIHMLKELQAKHSIQQQSSTRYLQLHKEKLFKDIVLGLVYSHLEIRDSLATLNFSLPEQELVCLILEVDDQRIYLKYEESAHLLDFSIVNVLEEVITSYAHGYVVNMGSKQFVAILSLMNREEKNRSKLLEELTDNMKVSLHKYLNTSVSIGVSCFHETYIEIKDSYKEAKKAIKHKFIYPRGSNIHYNDVSELPAYAEDLSAEMNGLEGAFNRGEDIAISAKFDVLISKIDTSSMVTLEQLSSLCHAIRFLSLQFMEKYQLRGKETMDKTMNEPIEKLIRKQDFLEWIQLLKQRFMLLFTENKDGIHVYAAKLYINKYYSEDLSLEKVADKLQLSASYLSNLFKKESGQNFVDYITEVRIQKAKELLKSTDQKIYEIASAVGFANEYYFSKVFKKIVGESPLKFR